MENKELIKKKKVLVIGLDGATFDVLGPLIEGGKLPHLKELIEKGASGNLESTIPPVTGPAWTSFITGKNPGKHGIFSFERKVPGSYERQIINSSSNASKTLWLILSESGRKVGALNVPATYPPEKVNGFIVSGLLTPDGAPVFTYPPDLSEELKKVFVPDELEVNWREFEEKDVERLVGALTRSTLKTLEATLYLMEKHEWDLFMTVFTGTDRIQHALWNFIGPGDNRSPHEREKRGMVMQYYDVLDDCIGQILADAGRDATVFVVSDHGFGRFEKVFFINTWLQKKGLLAFKPEPIGRRCIELLRRLDYFRLRRWVGVSLRSKIGSHASGDDGIDWSRTKAYAASNSEQGIYINLAGKDPQGVVQSGQEYEEIRESIIQELRELRDPATREKLLTAVFKREEVYSGLCIEQAPDIIFSLRHYGYLAQIQRQGSSLFREVNWNDGYGTHRMEGMFIAAGQEIEQGKRLEGVRIIDLPVTLLYLMGLGIPRDMDGTVVSGMLEEGVARANPVRYVDPLEESLSGKESGLTPEEEKSLVERLKGLGYMD